MSRVFLTGGSGLIGGALAARLADRGDELVALAIVRPGDPVGGLFVDEWAMLAAAVITVWSAVDYLVRALPALMREEAGT